MSYIITRTMSLICKSSVIESQTIAINRPLAGYSEIERSLSNPGRRAL